MTKIIENILLDTLIQCALGLQSHSDGKVRPKFSRFSFIHINLLVTTKYWKLDTQRLLKVTNVCVKVGSDSRASKAGARRPRAGLGGAERP